MILLLASMLLSGGAARGLAAAAVTSWDDIKFWAGTGPNRAAMVIDWSDGKNAPGESAGQSLVWGFRWDLGMTPTGEDMLRAIDAADLRLDVKLDAFPGFGAYIFGAGYDLDGDGSSFAFTLSPAAGSTTDSRPSDDHLAYSHFDASAGEYLYWAYYTNTGPGAVPGSSLPSSSQWQYSDIGVSSRLLENGSWDAFTLSGNDSFPPDAPLAAAPEPTTTLLLLLSGVGMASRRRRRS